MAPRIPDEATDVRRREDGRWERWPLIIEFCFCHRWTHRNPNNSSKDPTVKDTKCNISHMQKGTEGFRQLPSICSLYGFAVTIVSQSPYLFILQGQGACPYRVLVNVAAEEPLQTGNNNPRENDHLQYNAFKKEANEHNLVNMG